MIQSMTVVVVELALMIKLDRPPEGYVRKDKTRLPKFKNLMVVALRTIKHVRCTTQPPRDK